MLNEIIDVHKVRAALTKDKNSEPFDNWTIDNFFHDHIVQALENEFPDYDDEVWYQWQNPLEVKKARNDWNAFPPTTYKVINALNSPEFVDLLKECTKIEELYSDPGLNGAGWHTHPAGGHNNVHLDYSVHPKLGFQRKFNLIIYLTFGWQKIWGGALCLYKQDEHKRKPGELVKSISPLYNRAVFFDTTQNSWHGLPDPIDCPEDVCRKSIALYYLVPAPSDVEPRGKALFSPNKNQIGDLDVLELIKKRADVHQSKDVYITDSG
jgi:Rps23 Pro-64 3,4-dihydroxylase Tpa1-like proline 4-hydroxylase